MLWVGLSSKPSRRAKREMEEAKAAGHEVEYRKHDTITRCKTVTTIYVDELSEIPAEQQKANEPTERNGE